MLSKHQENAKLGARTAYCDKLGIHSNFKGLRNDGKF